MGAPKGNQFAIGNNGGQPPLYETVEQMTAVIDEYFASYQPNGDDAPNPVLGFKPTITGLALYLGFESRQSLYDYKKKKEFSYIIKKACLFIEMNYEQLLESKAATGAIFALKNMGWNDRSQIELGGDVNIPLMEWIEPPQPE